MHKEILNNNQIELKAIEMFGNAFSTKLFRQQLTYFNDIDYSEEVFYANEEPSKQEIESFLIDVATAKL